MLRLQEKVIDGVLHWRYAEPGLGFRDSKDEETEYVPYTLEELTREVMSLRLELYE